jgi:DNA relaxase NicK
VGTVTEKSSKKQRFYDKRAFSLGHRNQEYLELEFRTNKPALSR